MSDKEILPKAAYLTFDDGPNEPYTSQILDILKEFQIKASFFVCGKNVEYYPETTRKIVSEGHVIGNHSFFHSRFLSFTGFLAKEIEKTDEIIFKTTERKTKLFRPPWGVVTPWLKNYLKENDYKLFLWDIAPWDWIKSSPEKISKRVLDKIKPNNIILLHDGNRTCHNSDRSWTTKALPSIIIEGENRGFNFKTLD